VTLPPPATLDRRALGRSDVAVTRFVLGGAPLGGLFAPIDDAEAQATLTAAWDGGVRAFDTAPHYGVGLSETRMGRFLAGARRPEAVLVTKVGRLLVPTDDDVDGEDQFFSTPQMRRVLDYSRDGTRRSVEESCARLGMDRVDVALVHDPDDHFAQALDEALPALLELRAQGVVRAVGVGMNQASMLARFVRESDLDCVLVAGRWTLLDRSAGDELLPLCAERGVGVLVAGVLNSGILADPRPGATYDYRPAPAPLVEQARRLQRTCERHGVSLRTAALQYPLRHPAVTAVVVGARTPAEVETDLADLNAPLPEALWTALAHGADAATPA
jgi:D-threo-aldose 1-dehydrogenase